MKKYIPSFNDFEITEDENKQILITEITDDQYQTIDYFIDSYVVDKKPFDKFIPEFEKATNEGLLGRIGGGLIGMAAGQAIGRYICKVLGIPTNSVLYNVLTSRAVAIAVGSAIGKK